MSLQRKRERETIHEIEITILDKIREREDFHQGNQHIAVFLKKRKTATATTKVIALTMTEIEAQVEKETSDS